MRVRRLIAASAVIATAVGGGAASASAAVDAGLVLRPADVPGLRAAGSGSAVARTALGVSVPRSLRGATVSGAAFRAGTGRLQVGTFALASAARSRVAYAALTRGARRTRGIGDAAAQRTRITSKATTTVVILRVGRAVGAIRVTATGRDTTAAARARAYAGSLALRLRRVLAITGWQRVLGGIRADGTYAPQTALQAFAIAYGPIPGVARPRGALGVPTSATLAMQMVARVWDKLTPAQQKAIDQKLGAPHDASSPRVARASVQTLTQSAKFLAIANKYNAIYHAKIPGVPPITIKAFKASEDITTPGGGKAWADALPVNAAGEWGTGSPAYCRVRVPPFGQAEVGKPFFELVMAHETFHCVQFALMAAWRQRSAWLIEGMADWAAVTADPVSAAVGAGPYKLYLDTPLTPLFSRVYDGSGFWGHIDEAFGAGSLWAKIPDILNAGGDPGSYAVAGGSSPAFVDTWASAMLRYVSAGSAWYQRHPYAISSGSFKTPTIDLSDDGNLSSDAYTTRPYHVLPKAKNPLVEISRTSGSLQAGTEKTDLGPVGGDDWFCLGGTCKCPPKKTSTIPRNTKVSGDFIALGQSGGAGPAFANVSYHSLDEFCKDKQDPHGPAETNGDPHLTSFDGLHFDYQAAGEFILAKSRSGDLVVQERQEPYGNSTTVTVNTQIAMKVAGHRVTVSPGATKDDPPVARIDGTVDALPDGAVRSFGDASVYRSGEHGDVNVSWPDGSLVDVRPVGNYGVAARIELTDSRAGTMSGLLGDFDGNPGDDLTVRGGASLTYTTLPTEASWAGLTRYKIKQEYTFPFTDLLYNRFGDSWRIKPSESLFDYGPGQSTRTFDKRAIPTSAVDPAKLSAQKRAAAEKICRAHGVTQPGPLADCITDIAATGNEAFADDARTAQDAALVSWTRLSAGADRRAPLALLATRDGLLHLGIEEFSPATTTYRLLDVTLDGTGREGAPEIIDPHDGSVSLLPAPDGSARALAAQIPDSGPSGVFQYARSAAGAWSPLGPATTEGFSYAGLPIGVFASDATLLTISPMAGNARVFRGTGDPNAGIDPNPELPGCYTSSPSLARDGATGAIWAAWVQWNCPQQGAFARQIDPATGAPVGPEIKAPGSTWTTNTGEQFPNVSLNEAIPFTGRPGQPGVYMAFASDDGARVRLWKVGAATTSVIPKRQADAGDVRLSADPTSGRLWIAWREAKRLWAQPTGTTGVPVGVPTPADPPRGANPPFLSLHNWDIAARDGGLDILYGYVRDGDTPGALWHGRVTP